MNLMKENNLFLNTKSTKLAVQAPSELLYTENKNQRKIHMGKKNKEVIMNWFHIHYARYSGIKPAKDLSGCSDYWNCPFKQKFIYKYELAFSLSPFTKENTKEKERGKGKEREREKSGNLRKKL